MDDDDDHSEDIYPPALPPKRGPVMSSNANNDSFKRLLQITSSFDVQFICHENSQLYQDIHKNR